MREVLRLGCSFGTGAGLIDLSFPRDCRPAGPPSPANGELLQRLALRFLATLFAVTANALFAPHSAVVFVLLRIGCTDIPCGSALATARRERLTAFCIHFLPVAFRLRSVASACLSAFGLKPEAAASAEWLKRPHDCRPPPIRRPPWPLSGGCRSQNNPSRAVLLTANLRPKASRRLVARSKNTMV